MFLEKSIPQLEFCRKKSSLDGCDSMLHDDWLDIPCVLIPHSFCFKPRMVSDKNSRRNIFTIIFLCLFHKGITGKRWKLMLSLESAYFRTEARPWETFELCFKLVKWFPLQHQPLCAYLKIRTMRSTIFMINICIYNHPFKVFMNRKYEGLKISCVAMLERPIDSRIFSYEQGFDEVFMK